MAISSTTNRVNYTGNGVTTAFSFPYAFQAQADLVVIETVIATGVQTTKALTTDYTISGTTDGQGFYPSGGTVTMLTAPASTIRLTIYRDPAATQTVDLVENDPLPAEVLESAYDKAVMLIQRLKDVVGRSLRQPEGDSADIAVLPAKVTRAGKLLQFNSTSGDPEAVAAADLDLATVTPFIGTLLDDTTAADARTTLGAVASGDLAGYQPLDADLTAIAALSQSAGGVIMSNGSAWVRSDIPLGRNRLINPDGAIYQRAVAATADDVYFADRWYILSQTGTVTPSALTDPEDGFPSGVRITQSQASAQRFGYAQIIESRICKDLRGKSGVFVPRIRISNSQAVRYAILGWTSTADSVTSDVVADWTSGTYTAGNFFLGSNLSVIAVGAQTPSASTWTSLTAITAALGSTFNNIIVMVWTEGTAAQNVTLDFDFNQFEQGSIATPFERRQFPSELVMCQRYYEKSYDLASAPGALVTGGQSYWVAPGTLGRLAISFQTKKLAAPTMTIYSPGTGTAARVRDLTAGADVTASVTNTGEQATLVTFTSTDAREYAAQWTAEVEL